MMAFYHPGESPAQRTRPWTAAPYAPAAAAAATASASEAGGAMASPEVLFRPSHRPQLAHAHSTPYARPYGTFGGVDGPTSYAESRLAGPTAAAHLGRDPIGLGVGHLPDHHGRLVHGTAAAMDGAYEEIGRSGSPIGYSRPVREAYYSPYASPQASPYLSSASETGSGGRLLRHAASDSRLRSHTAYSPNPAFSQQAAAVVSPRFPSSAGPSPVVRAVTPDPSSAPLSRSRPSSIRVLQWTPQRGEEDTQVTIILDAAAIQQARPSPYSGAPAMFGPNGASNFARHASGPANRRFVVLFGQAVAPTDITRAQVIDGNGVGQSMSAGPHEEDAFVILTTFVPSRQKMGPPGERITVHVQTVENGSDAVIESCVVGEWEAPSVYTVPAPQPVTPRVHALKRAGSDLYSGRSAPNSRSPASDHHFDSPVRNQGDWTRSPSSVHHESAVPRTPNGSVPAPSFSRAAPPPAPPPAAAAEYAEPAADPQDDRTASVQAQADARYPQQPQLVRTSQITGSKNGATYSHKVALKMQGDLNTMAMGWSNEEWTARRRLVQFWPQQDANVLNLSFRPIAQSEYVPNTIVISCIFRDEWNECFVTSVDAIYLLEALVGARFSVEEKNRIRRNLEGFKPMTVSKSKPDAESFFKLIMGFPNPKPRNIEKDVKVFPWKVLAQALKKVMSKYSANYPIGADGSVVAPSLSASPATPPAPLATDAQLQQPSPKIVHTVASPALDGARPQTAGEQVHARTYPATTPVTPYLSPPGQGTFGGSGAHLGGIRSAPHSPSAGQVLRAQPFYDDTVLDAAPGFDYPGYKAPALALSGGAGDSMTRSYSSFARPVQQAHLFPAAEDYGVLASYAQPQSYSAEPHSAEALYEHQDARSAIGLGMSTNLSAPISHAHLRSVSEGLQSYAHPPLGMSDPIEIDGFPSVVESPLADGTDEALDLARGDRLNSLDDIGSVSRLATSTRTRSHTGSHPSLGSLTEVDAALE